MQTTGRRCSTRSATGHLAGAGERRSIAGTSACVSLARRLLSDPAAAEDVVQDVSHRARSRARSGRFPAARRRSGKTFLLGIAVKRVRRHHLARGAAPAARARAAACRRPARTDGSRAGRLPAATRRAVGDGARRGLPLPAQRVAFVLCEVEELTSVQAALVADAPEATIRTRLFHARRRLRDLLAAEQLR